MEKPDPGVVLGVDKYFGLVMCPLNALNPSVYVYFDSTSILEGASLRQLTDDLRDIFSAGTEIEFTLERKTDAFISKDGVTALRCSRIRILPYTNVPPLVLQPLLVIQARSNRSSMSFALTGNGELVALHPQLATYDNMLKRVVSGECNERSHFEEFDNIAMWGRTVEGRLGSVPQWFRSLHPIFQRVDFLLHGLQDYGRDHEGFAVIKVVEKAGIQLEPLDTDVREKLGLIYFPKELLSAAPDAMEMNAALPKRLINGKFWYKACRELPGRQFAHRAYQIVLVQEASSAQSKNTKTSSVLASSKKASSIQNAPNVNDGRKNPPPRDLSPKSLLPEDLFVVEVNQPVTEVLAEVIPPLISVPDSVDLPSDTSPLPSVPVTPVASGSTPRENTKDANNNEGFWFTRSSSRQSTTDAEEAAGAAISHIVNSVDDGVQHSPKASEAVASADGATETKKASKPRKSTKSSKSDKKTKHPSMPAVEGTIIDFSVPLPEVADSETAVDRTERAEASPSASESATKSDLDELAEIFEARTTLVDNIVTDDVYGKFFGGLLANQKPSSS